MAQVLWSSLLNGQVVTFNPNVDQLVFDGGVSSRRDLSFWTFSGTLATFTDLTGKTVSFNGLAMTDITTTNLIFQGSTARFYVGDLAVGSLSDEAANTINGGSGHDVIYGRGGNDLVFGGGGDDLIFGAGEGNDTIDGGDGVDTYSAYGGTPSGFTANLYTGFVYYHGASEVDTLISIESLRGTMQDDTMIGDQFNNYFTGRGGLDFILGGGGADWVYYNNSEVSQGAVVNLENNEASSDGHGSRDVLVDIEHVTGSRFDDRLQGDWDSNILRGEAGNDTLIGGGGNDTLRGGAGNDVIHGGFADGSSDGDASYLPQNVADYSDAAAAVTVSLNTTAAQNTGGAGTDTLRHIQSLWGSQHNDRLTGSTQGNYLTGGSGNDTLVGLAGDDTLHGGAGNDRIDGGAGAGDTASYHDAAGGVTVNLALTTQQNTVNAGLDTLMGVEHVDATEFADRLTGSAAANWIGAFGGNDTVLGGAGNDTVYGSQGDDSIDGGLGADTVHYGDAESGVTVNLAITAAQNTGGGGVDILRSIERLVGSEYDDSLSGNAADNVLEGGEGADTMVGGAGNDLMDGGNNHGIYDPDTGEFVQAPEADRVSYAAATGGVSVDLAESGQQDIGGGQGWDTLRNIEQVVGSRFADVLRGGWNDSNLLDGGAGNDWLGVTGSSYAVDRLDDPKSDTVIGGLGVDTLELDFWNFNSGTLYDEFGSWVGNVYGGMTLDLNLTTAQRYAHVASGQDYSGNSMVWVDKEFEGWLTVQGIENVIGSQGNDHIIGTSGANVINGGWGDDTLVGGAGTDTVSYEEAGGWLNSGVTVSLAITTAQDTGEAGIDTLSGFENLIGSSQDDNLRGNAVANQLTGGEGADTLFGGAGADRFIYRSDMDSWWSEQDVITDFSAAQNDKIDLSALTTVTALSFIGADAFSLVAGQVRFDASQQQLQADLNGDGGAEFVITLAGLSSFAESSLIV